MPTISHKWANSSGAGHSTLQEGAKVSFELKEGRSGLHPVRMTPATLVSPLASIAAVKRPNTGFREILRAL